MEAIFILLVAVFASVKFSTMVFHVPQQLFPRWGFGKRMTLTVSSCIVLIFGWKSLSPSYNDNLKASDR